MRSPWLRAALLLIVSGAVVGAWLWLRARRADDPPPPPAFVEPAEQTFALLVACTEYPELKQVSDPETYESAVRLLGPENDSALMREVLRTYLGVPEGNIRVLAGWPEQPQQRPTRANILAGLDWLRDVVSEGAHVLFLYGGHGTQQPDDGTDEADGRDEVLLPADAGLWDPETGGVKGAIRDDEVHQRLVAIRDAGASVWAIFDCCHSGTMMRGPAPTSEGGEEDLGPVRLRWLDPQLLGIPDEAVPVQAVARGGPAPVSGMLGGGDESTRGIAAFYAAHSWERAPEMKLPRNRWAADRRNHGLCTYLVARALQHHGGGLTLAEIIGHVRAAYRELPWSDATPVAEGDLTLRAVTGVRRARPVLLLRREAGRLLLDAGSLRGLTVGSVLEVYRPGGLGEESARLGRVALSEVEPLRSACGPVAGGIDLSAIPEGAPARIVEVAPGGAPLPLALVDAGGRELPGEHVRALQSRTFPDPRVAAQYPFVAPDLALWHLRELPIGQDQVSRFLLTPAGVARGDAPIEVELAELRPVLERLRRATMLRGWAASGPLSGLPEGLQVDARVRRLGSQDVEAMHAATRLAPGDEILLRITNATGSDVDVAIKSLDCAQVEGHVWPPEEACRRFSREDTRPVDIDPLRLTDDGVGPERLLLILAVRKQGAALLEVDPLAADESEPDPIGDQEQRELLGALNPLGAASRGEGAPESETVRIHELAWTTSWGRLGVPREVLEGMAAVEPPAQSADVLKEGLVPPGYGLWWRRARVLAGDEDRADVLLLSGDRGEGKERVLGIWMDEDGDARLRDGDPAELARRAAVGALPVEVHVLLGGSTNSAAYPKRGGGRFPGTVRVESDSAAWAAMCFDVAGDGWQWREACGPWLSTAWVPLSGDDPGEARRRLVNALRRFSRPN